MPALGPGTPITASLTVANPASSATLRYAVTSSATNADAKALKDAVTLSIAAVDVTTPHTPCDDFDGAQLYTGDLDATAGKLVGDGAAGAQAGDRTLTNGTSEILCFRVELPDTAGSSVANATTTATFTFHAESA